MNKKVITNYCLKKDLAVSDIVIIELAHGKWEVKGFLLSDGEENLLYPEPKLTHCCSQGNLRRGFYLGGKIPEESLGKCVTLQGYFESPERFIVEETSSAGGLGGWPYLMILLFVVIWQGYRLAQKKGGYLLKSLRVR